MLWHWILVLINVVKCNGSLPSAMMTLFGIKLERIFIRHCLICYLLINIFTEKQFKFNCSRDFLIQSTLAVLLIPHYPFIWRTYSMNRLNLQWQFRMEVDEYLNQQSILVGQYILYLNKNISTHPSREVLVPVNQYHSLNPPFPPPSPS